jgi:alkylated DNA nucleotide flippase Atl1
VQTGTVDSEEYVESVLRVVEAIPTGRVMSYGAIAECVGQGGPRQVGAVMAAYGGSVSWWRVVRADGTPPLCDTGEARTHYLAEGTPLRGRLDSGVTRVDMAAAAWHPEAAPSAPRPGGGRIAM